MIKVLLIAEWMIRTFQFINDNLLGTLPTKNKKGKQRSNLEKRQVINDGWDRMLLNSACINN